MIDGGLYQRLRPKLNAWGEVSRVENSIESGMWDIFYMIEGQYNWLETKAEHSGFLYFERFQLNWARRFLRAGATNLFVVAALEGHGDIMEIYPAQKVVTAPREIYRKWQRIKTSDLNAIQRMRKPYDWEVLRTLLSRPFTEV